MGGGGPIELPKVPTEIPDVPAGKEGVTGYGLQDGPMTNIWGGPLEQVESFPPESTHLEKNVWFNWSLNQERPPFVSRDVAENRRVWQNVEMERMLDCHPAHEVHANDLPDYHFWPRIQNELHPTPKAININNIPHYQDQSHLPRFHKNGIPKTPPQEQDFFLPLKNDGTFDWKLNIKKHGYTGSLVDKMGWQRRYYLPISRPNFPGPMHVIGARSACQAPIYFRHTELPFPHRMVRAASASYLDKKTMFGMFYCAGLAYVAGNDMRYKRLNWGFEPWNYEMVFNQYARDQGGFHGAV